MEATDHNGSIKEVQVLPIPDKKKEHKTVNNKTAGNHAARSPLMDIAQTQRLNNRGSENGSQSRMYDASEATMMMDFRQMQNWKTRHRLILLAGGLKNKTYLLDRRQLMIGRDHRADLRIHDRSVSKFHALICIKNNKCVLKDLNSINGVIVNGARIHDKKRLVDADKIEIGSHLFAFIQGSSAKSFRRQIRQNLKTIITMAAALICCIFMVIGASLFFACDQDQTNTKPIEKTTWEREPDRLKNGIDVRTAQTHYHAGHAFIEKRHYIVNSTTGTIYKAPSSASQILSIVTKGGLLTVILSAGQWSKVLSDAGVMGWIHTDVLKKKRAISFNNNRPMGREQSGNGVTHEDEGLSLLEQSLGHYIAGRMDLAIESLEKVLQLDLPDTNPIKVNASASKKAIEDIARRYSAGMQHFKNRKMKQTIGSWEQALAWDRQLVGPSDSHLSREIAMHTADMFYQMARSAIKRGEKEEARENCSKAFRAQKEHKGCVEIMSPLLHHPKKVSLR
jgi:uncharacterized protein YgiM (DUF1202 family)